MGDIGFHCPCVKCGNALSKIDSVDILREYILGMGLGLNIMFVLFGMVRSEDELYEENILPQNIHEEKGVSSSYGGE